jgi:hypothetical protein
VLTEHEVSRSWRTLFRDTGWNEETLTRAEQLLDELRPESPLRHRLDAELDELRKRATKTAKTTAKSTKTTKKKTS